MAILVLASMTDSETRVPYQPDPEVRKRPFCPGCGLFYATRGVHRADCTKVFRPVRDGSPTPGDTTTEGETK